MSAQTNDWGTNNAAELPSVPIFDFDAFGHQAPRGWRARLVAQWMRFAGPARRQAETLQWRPEDYDRYRRGQVLAFTLGIMLILVAVIGLPTAFQLPINGLLIALLVVLILVAARINRTGGVNTASLLVSVGFIVCIALDLYATSTLLGWGFSWIETPGVDIFGLGIVASAITARRVRQTFLVTGVAELAYILLVVLLPAAVDLEALPQRFGLVTAPTTTPASATITSAQLWVVLLARPTVLFAGCWLLGSIASVVARRALIRMDQDSRNFARREAWNEFQQQVQQRQVDLLERALAYVAVGKPLDEIGQLAKAQGVDMGRLRTQLVFLAKEQQRLHNLDAELKQVLAELTAVRPAALAWDVAYNHWRTLPARIADYRRRSVEPAGGLLALAGELRTNCSPADDALGQLGRSLARVDGELQEHLDLMARRLQEAAETGDLTRAWMPDQPLKYGPCWRLAVTCNLLITALRESQRQPFTTPGAGYDPSSRPAPPPPPAPSSAPPWPPFPDRPRS